MRQTYDLNGSWKFALDPFNKGERENWSNKQLPNAKKVTVPHIWQTEGEECISYNGAAWYQKKVSLTNQRANQSLYLCFGAIDYSCEVWWNGHFIGEHEGGFTPFEFLLPAGLLKEDNNLAIRVYDYEANAEIPIGKQGSWYTRVSGIWQSVKIESRSATYISNAIVVPNIEQQKIEVTAFIKGEVKDNTKVRFTIKSHSIGEQEWKSDEHYTGLLLIQEDNHPLFTEEGKTAYSLELPVTGMKQWSPTHPYLYEIEFVLEEDDLRDSYDTTFGFRSVGHKNGRVLVNNEAVYIRGALDQAFYPDTIYRAPSEEFIIKEIQQAKAMGFNMLRKHIKAEIPQYLYWADRLGMLIWAEPPNYVKWTKSAQERFVQLFKEMLIRDYNHPSIIMWSIYNEEWGLEWDLDQDKEKQQHVLQLFAQAKKWDETRLFCDNSGWSHLTTDINDHHRYFALPEQVKEWQEDLDGYILKNPSDNFVDGYYSQNEPILVSEFGMWGLPDINKMKEYYQGIEPWWFVNQGDGTHQDDYKKPITALNNFSKFGIKQALGSIENTALISQRRMVRGVKSLIEEMRKRPQLGGYIVTELTDIEWETNGWLDFMRNPKEGFERLIDFNGPVCVMANLSARNCWTDDLVSIDLIIADDENLFDKGRVKWEVVDENHLVMGELEGELDVTIGSERLIELPRAIHFTVPSLKKSQMVKLMVTFEAKDQVVARNEEELTFTSITGISIPEQPVFLTDELKSLKLMMKEAGVPVSNEIKPQTVVITENLTPNVISHVRNGGHAVFLAEEGDRISEKGQYTFRELSLGESWARASSMNYVDTNWFKGVPLQPEMGMEAEALYPDFIVPFADYKKEGTKRTVNMFGNPRLADEGTVISGYFQGWMGQNGGSVIHHQKGQGSILLVTWKLKHHYGKHPIATQLLNTMITNIKNKD
ncbi:glycoside hydrolase family 2 protein [Jeotgalibacillus proteolyticus]|uniref:Glycoside hydrolase family 2 n=1 Tax=Jeotgalibacillus proteolyticus TaxID=2082395 RepID=A0A2S5GBT1_9BACL|nr:sugar-binding domain-containing protein [Jeotgalibacillus proteolyticus]PPA70492.1 glycoside hydrolase family 2 [Jeotgalibacillus proteolyticus]